MLVTFVFKYLNHKKFVVIKLQEKVNTDYLEQCLPKKERGLGFKFMFEVSQVMYAILWWRFIIEHAIWDNFLWKKYYNK